MAVRIWLDKDGKVLVSPEGNVYLSEECCCAKEPDPTVCWQLYSATVTTSEDGSSKGWAEPWMVDYTCLVSGSEPPGAAEWRYAQAGATRWVSFLGMCSECSVPHGADKPGLNVECIVVVSTPYVYDGIWDMYMGVATVVTYAVVRDESGVSVGQDVAGSTVVPNWRLTAVTPDDTDDFKYSQVLGKAVRVAAPLSWNTVLNPDKLDPYYWSVIGDTFVTNSYVVYDGHRYYLTLANGEILGNRSGVEYYATVGQDPMYLTMVGSRYSAVPQVSTGMTVLSSRMGAGKAAIGWGSTDWGHLEILWSFAGDTWYRPYIKPTAHRIARGADVHPTEFSRYERELPTYLSQSMAPMWNENVWVNIEFPRDVAADRALSLALSGVYLGTPRALITFIACYTNWYRLVGESWEGCPKDAGLAIAGWTTLWSREDTPEYLYLDTLIPMTDGRIPFGADLGVPLHEDDDALAQGSTVFRPFSSELGDGHCYLFTRIDIHNFPSWRTDLCSTVFEPTSVEVPNLIWKGTDMGKSLWRSNSNVGYGGPWPIQNLWITSTVSGYAGPIYHAFTQKAIAPVPDYFTRFRDSAELLYTTLRDDCGESVAKGYYTFYDYGDKPQSTDINAGIVVTAITNHVPGARVGYEYVEEHGFDRTSSMYDTEVTVIGESRGYAFYCGSLFTVGLDGHAVDVWRGYKVNTPMPLVTFLNTGTWHNAWLINGIDTVCAQDGLTALDADEISNQKADRFFYFNPHIPKDYWQLPNGCLIGPPASALLTRTAGFHIDKVSTCYGITSSSQTGRYTTIYQTTDVNMCVSHTLGGVDSIITLVNGIESLVSITSGYNRHTGYGYYMVCSTTMYSRAYTWSTIVNTKILTTRFTANTTHIPEGADGVGRVTYRKLGISSGLWAPHMTVDAIFRYTYDVTGTRYYTSLGYYTKRWSDGDGWHITSNFYSTITSDAAERYVSPVRLYDLTRMFGLVTAGRLWDPPGDHKVEAILAPGKATVFSSSGHYGLYTSDWCTGSYLNVTTMWVEASIKGANA